MIKLRNLALGSNQFSRHLQRGTSDNPFNLSADSPMLDLNTTPVDWSLTTGWTGLRWRMRQVTTAQASGTNYVARFRGENSVNTSIGTLVGLDAAAANNNDSASLIIIGLVATVLGKGKNASELRAADVIADNTEGVATITTFEGLRVRVIGAGTITNGPWALRLINDSESAAANAAPLKAFIKAESAVVSTVVSCFADATDCSLRGTALYSVTLTSKDNVLFYYKDFDGTAHALVASDADAVAIRT